MSSGPKEALNETRLWVWLVVAATATTIPVLALLFVYSTIYPSNPSLFTRAFTAVGFYLAIVALAVINFYHVIPWGIEKFNINSQAEVNDV